MRKARILCNGAILFCAGAGLYLNVHEPNAAAHTLLYFTAQSNLWLMGISGVFLWYDLLSREIPSFWHRIKYMFTVSILLTGFGYNLALAPQYARRFGCWRRAYSLSVTLLHVATPLLGAISYFFLDKRPPERKPKSRALLALAPPTCYCAWAMLRPALSKKPLEFDGIDGEKSKFPYFFMDYQNNGWFTRSKDPQRLGVAYWLLPMAFFVWALGALASRGIWRPGRRRHLPFSQGFGPRAQR